MYNSIKRRFFTSLIFALFTAVFVITALGMLTLGIETKGKTLEELATM